MKCLPGDGFYRAGRFPQGLCMSCPPTFCTQCLPEPSKQCCEPPRAGILPPHFTDKDAEAQGGGDFSPSLSVALNFTSWFPTVASSGNL